MRIVPRTHSVAAVPITDRGPATKGADLVNGSGRDSLANDLALDDLSFDGSDIIAGSEILAALEGVDTTTPDAFDFIVL